MQFCQSVSSGTVSAGAGGFRERLYIFVVRINVYLRYVAVAIAIRVGNG